MLRAYHALRRGCRRASTATSRSTWAMACWPISAIRKLTRTRRSGPFAPGLRWSMRSAGLAPPSGEPLGVRVGIATGLVVVGDLLGEGAAQSKRWSAKRRTSRRGCKRWLNPAGGDLPSTRRLLGGRFEYQRSGRAAHQGFRRAGAAWRVLREGGAESRFEAIQKRHRAASSGARRIWRCCTRRWGQAKQGEGRVVLLVGRGGDRQIADRRGACSTPRRGGATFASASMLAVSPTSALYPVIGQLDCAAGFDADDSPEAQAR